MMAAGMRYLDIPFLDGNMFKQVIMYYTRDIVINFVKISRYGVTYTSHSLLDCLYGSPSVPNMIICGACV